MEILTESQIEDEEKLLRIYFTNEEFRQCFEESIWKINEKKFMHEEHEEIPF